MPTQSYPLLAISGNTEVTAQCTAGYYCELRASTSTPTDGVTGDICPPGRYCPTGSPIGVDCHIGTFSNETGLVASTDCQDCTPGYYCGRTGLTQESGMCWSGKSSTIHSYKNKIAKKLQQYLTFATEDSSTCVLGRQIY